MNNSKYDNRLSSSISWIRFPLVFFIVLLHCYTSVQLPGSNHHNYYKVLYPFVFWLGETSVPAFFFISGYLYFRSNKSYWKKIKTRISTLVIPYFLWNSFILALYIALFLYGISLDICGKNISNYTFLDYIRAYWDRGNFDNGNFVPILIPYWYIRNLFLICILSPFFFCVIKVRFSFLFLLFTGIWWAANPTNAFIPETIFFFTLGAYFAIHRINPLKIFINNKNGLFLFFATFAILDVVSHCIFKIPYELQIHRMSLLFNIPIFFLIADIMSRQKYAYPKLTESVFIIFSIHYPIAYGIRTICIRIFQTSNDLCQIILYFISVFATMSISYVCFLLLNEFFPQIKNLFSGNR